MLRAFFFFPPVLTVNLVANGVRYFRKAHLFIPIIRAADNGAQYILILGSDGAKIY